MFLLLEKKKKLFFYYAYNGKIGRNLLPGSEVVSLVSFNSFHKYDRSNKVMIRF